MKKENKSISRKKFIVWGFGISLAAPAFLKIFARKKSESATAKMLTQDGRLVEIDVVNIPPKRNKLRTEDIRSWVNKTVL